MVFMGEKGNAAVGSVAAGTGSMIERITTTATETVTGVGTDFLETVKDKSIGAVAETTIDSARKRLDRKDVQPPADASADPQQE